MAECVFCGIIGGKLAAYKVYEDSHTLAILDKFPLARGHTLILPKPHRELLEDLSPEEAQALFRTVHLLVPRVQRAVHAPASLVGIHNGPESGQAVPHVHVHIVPRFSGDGGGTIHSVMRSRPRLSPEEFERISQDIRRLL